MTFILYWHCPAENRNLKFTQSRGVQKLEAGRTNENGCYESPYNQIKRLSQKILLEFQ
jgi:hypothetical protein